MRGPWPGHPVPVPERHLLAERHERGHLEHVQAHAQPAGAAPARERMEAQEVQVVRALLAGGSTDGLVKNFNVILDTS